jgi:hypothetical protein
MIIFVRYYRVYYVLPALCLRQRASAIGGLLVGDFGRLETQVIVPYKAGIEPLVSWRVCDLTLSMSGKWPRGLTWVTRTLICMRYFAFGMKFYRRSVHLETNTTLPLERGAFRLDDDRALRTIGVSQSRRVVWCFIKASVSPCGF